MNPPRYFALIPAAGVGARMGAACPKQYIPINGKPMLQHVLETCAQSQAITHTFVVVSVDDGHIQGLLADLIRYTGRVTVLNCGGATRRESVHNGLLAIREQVRDEDWMLVHDAARPGLTTIMIDRLIDAVTDDPVGGLLAMPMVDTLKRATADGHVEATVSRAALWAAQTPQMFRYALLRHALEQAQEATDEASAVEALGLQPRLVEGSPRNFKVTLPHDVELATLYLKGIA